MPITRPGLYACEQLPGMVAIAPEEGVGNHGRMMFVLWAGVKYRRSGADRNSRRCASALLHFPARTADGVPFRDIRSEEHTSELQSLMRISYAVFCLKKKK